MKKQSNLRTKIILSIVVLTIFGSIHNAFGQNENILERVQISGTIDTYFRNNLNNTNQKLPGNNERYSAPATSFANKPGFALGMANIIIAYEHDKVGFVGDFVFGPRGNEAVFGSPAGSAQVINQLYTYWMVSDKIKLTMGNFNTFLGYEVISPTGNFNYSTSYMFSYGPFSHAGLKADVDLGNGLSLMTGIFNPTDLTEFNPTSDYTGGLQLGYSVENGSLYLNTLFGNSFYQIDLTTGWNLNERFYTGINTSYAKDSFYGATAYLKYAASKKLSWGIRGEYFVDKGVEAIELDESVIDLTLSANYKVGSLTLIPEVRADINSYDGFMTEKGTMQKSLSSFLLAAVFSF